MDERVFLHLKSVFLSNLWHIDSSGIYLDARVFGGLLHCGKVVLYVSDKLTPVQAVTMLMQALTTMPEGLTRVRYDQFMFMYTAIPPTAGA